MSFAANTGTYTPATGAVTAAAGQTVQSAVWNAIFLDLSTALTQTMSQLLGTSSIMSNALWANGGLEIWQRGAGASSAIAAIASNTPGTYTADRWYILTGANQASTVTASAGLTAGVLLGSNLSAKVQRNNAQTGVTAMTFGYPLDTDEIVSLRGQALNISFLAKAGANWSPTSGTLSYAFYAGTGSVAKRGGGFTSETTVSTGTVNLTTSVSRTISVGTVIVPVTSTQGELQFTWTPVGTAGGDDSFYIDDVIVGGINSAATWTVPTSLDRIPDAVALANLQKHYWKSFPYATAPAQGAGVTGSLIAYSYGNVRTGLLVRIPNGMRNAPAITTYNPSGATANWQDVTTTVSIVATVTATASAGFFLIAATVSATDHMLYIHAQADAGI